MHRSVLAVVLLGCHGGDVRLSCGDGTVQDGTECVPDGQVPDDTGDDADPPTFEDVFDALPACEPSEGDGLIDLATGCVAGGCADMTLTELEEAYGDSAFCQNSSYTPDLMSCSWDNGVYIYLDDYDLDGVADEPQIPGSLGVQFPFEGATSDGLGIGSTWACFFEALGTPSSLDLWNLGGGELSIFYASWWDDNLSVFDFYGDGAATSMTVYAPE